MITDNNLRVTEFINQDQPQQLKRDSKLTIDGGHTVSLDEARRIKEFKFKDANGNIIYAAFNHAKAGYNTIVFNDGTLVLQSGKELLIKHDNKTLKHDSCADFAATYDMTQNFVQQIINQDKILQR